MLVHPFFIGLSVVLTVYPREYGFIVIVIFYRLERPLVGFFEHRVRELDEELVHLVGQVLACVEGESIPKERILLRDDEYLPYGIQCFGCDAPTDAREDARYLVNGHT